MEVIQPDRYSKIFAVVNPVAGSANVDLLLTKLRENCSRRGWEYEVYLTTGDEDLPALVRDAIRLGSDLVVAAGGDGTVSGVANGLVGTQVPMAIVPVGTGNVLARDRGISVNLNESLNLFSHSHAIQELDVMRINKRYYVLNASMGLSTMIMQNTLREDKRRFGIAAYVWVGIKSVFMTRPIVFYLSVDRHKNRLRATEVLIANGTLMGWQPPMQGLNVSPCDGLLDVFVLRAAAPLDFLRVGMRWLLGKPHPNPEIKHLTATHSIVIRSRRPQAVQADGELIGYTPIQVEIVPRSLRLVVPLPEARDTPPEAGNGARWLHQAFSMENPDKER
ncbi:MAG: diacylglycerol kinase family lipid kinase [Chloroflexi bacterium]|jgi:YegS/Rv2252/BmrU family lipid kinase|nr:diacylglycerol kinase family protein [Anaerolineaceae bacterium]NMB90799.1 diacylglycerol kinase family lipid kinase [Chloroflexota bacterium]